MGMFDSFWGHHYKKKDLVAIMAEEDTVDTCMAETVEITELVILHQIHNYRTLTYPSICATSLSSLEVKIKYIDDDDIPQQFEHTNIPLNLNTAAAGATPTQRVLQTDPVTGIPIVTVYFINFVATSDLVVFQWAYASESERNSIFNQLYVIIPPSANI